MAKRRFKRRFSRYSPRRFFRRHRKSKTVPILPLVGLGVGLIGPAKVAMQGNYEGALAELGARYTGYNFQSGVFDGMYALKNGYLPFFAGIAGHMIANKTGVNRYIKKVPVIGKWVSL